MGEDGSQKHNENHSLQDLKTSCQPRHRTSLLSKLKSQLDTLSRKNSSSQNCMGVSENHGTPKSSILIGFSIINHPFWGTPGNTRMDSHHPNIFGVTSWGKDEQHMNETTYDVLYNFSKKFGGSFSFTTMFFFQKKTISTVITDVWKSFWGLVCI